VDGCFHHGAIVVLAVDLDQPLARLAQEIDRDRLVVDEGPCASVLALQPAKDQIAIAVDAAFGEELADRVVGGEVEYGGHITLAGPVAHQRAVAAAAEGQRQGIEENRLAGTGLAGEHRHSGTKIDSETLDQNDVADRQGDEHVS